MAYVCMTTNNSNIARIISNIHRKTLFFSTVFIFSVLLPLLIYFAKINENYYRNEIRASIESKKDQLIAILLDDDKISLQLFIDEISKKYPYANFVFSKEATSESYNVNFHENSFGSLVFNTNTFEMLDYKSLFFLVLIFTTFQLAMLFQSRKMIKSFRSLISQPIEKLSICLEEQKEFAYSGEIREILTLTKAINISQKKIFEHVTAETIRWVAHDLKQPLDIALKFAQRFSLLDEGQKQDFVSRNLKVLMHQTMIARSIIEDLQEISIEPRIRKNRTRVSEIIEDSTLNFETNVTIDNQCEQQETIDVDKGRLARALRNIVSNAVEAHQGNSSDVVLFEIRKAENSIIFKILNTGSYISRENLGSIFGEFFTSGKNSGRGIGLAIAKKMVEAHGGKITVISNGYSEKELLPRRLTSKDYVEFTVKIPLNHRI